MDFLSDLWGYIKTHKKFVFLPIIIVLLISAFFITLSAVPAVAPFIYALFWTAVIYFYSHMNWIGSQKSWTVLRSSLIKLRNPRPPGVVFYVCLAWRKRQFSRNKTGRKNARLACPVKCKAHLTRVYGGIIIWCLNLRVFNKIRG